MRRAGQLLYTVIAALLVAAGTLTPSPASTVRATAPPLHRLRGQTPTVVVDGAAHLLARHNQADVLTVVLALAVRDAAALDALITVASDPSSPSYGRYLTNQDYHDRFAPTDAQAAAVRDWASSEGLEVVTTSPDNLLVVVRGTTARVERAFSTTIADYRLAGVTFHANSGDVAVPAGLAIDAVSGLSTLRRPHTMRAPLDARGSGYFPRDFQAAYNTSGVGVGANQTIGFTLWGASLPQSDMTTFANHTGAPPLTVGVGSGQIEFISTNDGSTDTSALDETALDVETAHGMASNAHLKYWLGDCAYDSSMGVCNPSDAGLEIAVSDAANDASLHVVSNSWGSGEPTSPNDPFVAAIEPSLQHAVAVGTTFYFSTGDQGAYSGTTTSTGPPEPSYPADSPYVVAVGGTNLQTNAANSYSYGSETAWSCSSEANCISRSGGGSGGGCSSVFARPAWQIGVVAAGCTGRAIPDISAAGDPTTGAYIAYNGGWAELGGTSLSAPLWAGMSADLNQCLAAHNAALMGFSAPRIYQLANNPTTYSRDFHDVTSGFNGAYAAGMGWDEVTGWGSPNLANLATDWPTTGSVSCNASSPPPTVTPTASTSAISTTAPTATVMPMATSTIVVPTVSPTVNVIPLSSPTTNPGSTATPVQTTMPSPSATATTGVVPTTPSPLSSTPSIATSTATATPSATSATPTMEAPSTTSTTPPTATPSPTAPSTTAPSSTTTSTAANTPVAPVAVAPTSSGSLAASVTAAVPRASVVSTVGGASIVPTRTSVPAFGPTPTSPRATVGVTRSAAPSRSMVRVYIAGGRLPVGGQVLLVVGNATPRAAHLFVTFYDGTGAVHHTGLSLIKAKTRRTISLTRLAPSRRAFGLTVASDQDVAGALVLVTARGRRQVLAGVVSPATHLRLTGLSGSRTLATVLNANDRVSHLTMTPQSRHGRAVTFTVPAHAQTVVDLGRTVSNNKKTLVVLLTADRAVVIAPTAS